MVLVGALISFLPFRSLISKLFVSETIDVEFFVHSCLSQGCGPTEWVARPSVMESNSAIKCECKKEPVDCCNNDDGRLSQEEIDEATAVIEGKFETPDLEEIPRDKRVDMRCVYDYFLACIREDEQIDVDAYLNAYAELNRFFELLGTVFHFVASDVRSKLDIMESFRKSEESERYATIQSMVAYEKGNAILQRKDPVSGSRTLLRLHRALAFITNLLDRLSKLQDNDKIVSQAQEAYKTTLAKYHPWLIQKAALMAMYTLPTRAGLLATTCQDESVGSELLPDVVNITKRVYDKTQEIYSVNEILDLP